MLWIMIVLVVKNIIVRNILHLHYITLREVKCKFYLYSIWNSIHVFLGISIHVLFRHFLMHASFNLTLHLNKVLQNLQ